MCCGGTTVVRAVAGRIEFVRREVVLAADAVEAVVGRLVEVAGRRARAPECLDADAVPRVAAGPDEIVVTERQRTGQGGESGGVRVDEGTDVDAGGLGGQYVLERVVVGAGQQPYGFAALPPMAGQDIRLYGFQRETDVRRGVDVRDRGGQERGHRCLRTLRKVGAAVATLDVAQQKTSPGFGGTRFAIYTRVSGPGPGASSGRGGRRTRAS